MLFSNRQAASLPLLQVLCILPLFLSACGAAPEETDTAEMPAAVGDSAKVKSGINDKFKDPAMEVDDWLENFEVESREVFVAREDLAKAVGLKPGQAMADIGSGTGLFLPYFVDGVGKDGKIFAVDISPRFIDHLSELAKSKGWDQVEPVFCTDRETNLEAASIDAAFICDTYHHFEFPGETMASLHQAMRPNGLLVIVDFKRIEGETSEWIMGHVRCGKQMVIDEVEAAGFTLEDEVDIPALSENYVIRFRRK
jgi:SAM-dependent methyltransferase